MWESTIDLRDRTNVEKLLFEELRNTSKSITVVLMEDFNLPRINWEHHTAGTTELVLKNLDNNFMVQVLREQTWKDALLDLLLVNRVDLMREVEVGVCLGHSEQEVIEFKISIVTGGKVPAKSQLQT
ncbi:hypothetical protein BTVI_12169 [Pitangus sulphuratus]|nr:hypothetical protein BTVI_12169 [Pitangus sulphuratus]